jgi:hypothetical protein
MVRWSSEMRIQRARHKGARPKFSNVIQSQRDFNAEAGWRPKPRYIERLDRWAERPEWIRAPRLVKKLS